LAELAKAGKDAAAIYDKAEELKKKEADLRAKHDAQVKKWDEGKNKIIKLCGEHKEAAAECSKIIETKGAKGTESYIKGLEKIPTAAKDQAAIYEKTTADLTKSLGEVKMPEFKTELTALIALTKESAGTAKEWSKGFTEYNENEKKAKEWQANLSKVMAKEKAALDTATKFCTAH
jgi:hypothetical protein